MFYSLWQVLFVSVVVCLFLESAYLRENCGICFFHFSLLYFGSFVDFFLFILGCCHFGVVVVIFMATV